MELIIFFIGWIEPGERDHEGWGSRGVAEQSARMGEGNVQGHVAGGGGVA